VLGPAHTLRVPAHSLHRAMVRSSKALAFHMKVFHTSPVLVNQARRGITLGDELVMFWPITSPFHQILQAMTLGAFCSHRTVCEDGLNLLPVSSTLNNLWQSRRVDRPGSVSMPGLQQVHMKDRMDFHGHRQVQLIGHRTYSLYYL
jgi:hypothetical protein